MVSVCEEQRRFPWTCMVSVCEEYFIETAWAGEMAGTFGEDFLWLQVGTHAGMSAIVSSHTQTFPEHLEMRPLWRSMYKSA